MKTKALTLTWQYQNQFDYQTSNACNAIFSEFHPCSPPPGGGPAALSCAETLRQEGYTGRIVMIVKEKHLPYDRVKLSKELHVDASSLELRKKTFFDVRPCFGSVINHVFKIQNALA